MGESGEREEVWGRRIREQGGSWLGNREGLILQCFCFWAESCVLGGAAFLLISVKGGGTAVSALLDY